MECVTLYGMCTSSMSYLYDEIWCVGIGRYEKV